MSSEVCSLQSSEKSKVRKLVLNSLRVEANRRKFKSLSCKHHSSLFFNRGRHFEHLDSQKGRKEGRQEGREGGRDVHCAVWSLTSQNNDLKYDCFTSRVFLRLPCVSLVSNSFQPPIFVFSYLHFTSVLLPDLSLSLSLSLSHSVMIMCRPKPVLLLISRCNDQQMQMMAPPSLIAGDS